ncbi:hypothetical protein Godav_005356 [Gossypium davidsonii]|uniref:Uncharacterized protein n=1 Tax=Gossypium davidsonii TaxID=34287 RepID=A0A7J8T4Y8_GOSDV|nr:hypothetical protein [Gossypium davidsonii]
MDDEEEAPTPCEGDLHKEDEDHQFCLVGKALTDCVIHFLVLDGMPWSFNMHLLVFHQLIKGEDPK